jgi:hypothetical protein
MFLLQTTHEEILANVNRLNQEKSSKECTNHYEALENLRTKQARELDTAKYNYNTKVARLENEKIDTIMYKDQAHKQELSALKASHNLEITELETKHTNALSTMKAKYDAKEIELTQAVRNANNDAELTKANAALVAERIEKDAESRIKTAEQAASVVLANAQLEVIHVVAAGKAKGEELSYQIAKNAQENIADLYEDIIDTLTTKIPLEPIDLTKIKDIITASTQNFPKTVSGDIKVTNSNSK